MDRLSSLSATQKDAILASSVIEPPEGKMSDFVNPPNGAAGSEAVLAITFALSTVAVIGRVYTRLVLKSWLTSDYILVLGYTLFLITFVYDQKMARNPGFFVDLWNVHWGEFILYLHNFCILSFLYDFDILLIKVAILLEWLHLFVPPGSRNFIYWASHVNIWFNVSFYLSVFVAAQLACTPYEYNWNKLLDGNCDRVNTKYTNLASGVFNVISDIVILLSPQKVIWKLNMRVRLKAGISIIFGIGVFGCAIATIRLVETVKYSYSTDYSGFPALSGTLLCSAAELTAGILVICVPSLPKAYASLKSGELKRKFSSRAAKMKNGVWVSHDGDRDRSWPESRYVKAPSLEVANTEYPDRIAGSNATISQAHGS
ncbi:hypothetical protein F4808DRAFT_463428 [Astrocystis sublimbata]|nr:hypothetical protein F4808DRAFT_463428 [Astrocystis sublimbata]